MKYLLCFIQKLIYLFFRFQLIDCLPMGQNSSTSVPHQSHLSAPKDTLIQREKVLPVQKKPDESSKNLPIQTDDDDAQKEIEDVKYYRSDDEDDSIKEWFGLPISIDQLQSIIDYTKDGINWDFNETHLCPIVKGKSF